MEVRMFGLPRKILLLFFLLSLVISKLYARPGTNADFDNLNQKYFVTAERIVNSHPDSAIGLAEEALEIARKGRNPYSTAKAYFILGAGYFNKASYDKSEMYYFRALRQFERTDSTSDITRTWLNLSLLYRDMGDIEHALGYIQKAVEAFDRAKDIAGLARAYYLIGGVYWKFQRFDEAIVNYTKAANTWKLTGNVADQIKSLTNSGYCYRDAGRYNEAQRTFSGVTALARSVSDTALLVSALRNQSAIYLLMGDTAKSLYGYRNALKLAAISSDSSLQATIYEDIGKLYRTKALPGRALSYFMKAYGIRKALSNPKLLASVSYQLGLTYSDLKNYPEALRLFFTALDKARESDDMPSMAASYKSVASIFDYTSNYTQSVRYCKLAMEIESRLGDANRLSLTHIMLGNALRNLHKYEEALKEYSAALDLRISRLNASDVAGIYNNIGNVYLDMREYRKAFTNYNTALEAAKLKADTFRMAEVYNNLGNAWRMTGNNNMAIVNFTTSANLYHLLGHWYGYSLAQRKTGEIYLEMDRLVDAFPPLEQAFKSGEKENDFELLRHAAHSLSDYYSAVGNTAKALLFYKRYADFTDSVTLAKTNRLLTETQVNYELGKLESQLKAARDEVEILETRSALREAQIRRERLVRWFVLAFTTLLGVTLTVIIYYFRRNSKTNILLSEKLAIIEAFNQKLNASEKELKSLLATRDKFFSIIAHDLRNPISGLMMAAESLAIRGDEYDEEEKKAYHQAMLESSKNLFALLENLLQWSRSQTGRIAFNPKMTDLYSLVAETCDVLKIQATEKEISLINQVPPGFSIMADAAMITTIVRNLISNAIKFTHKSGQVSVSATDHNQHFLLTVADNGTGMTPEQVSMLFRIDSGFSMPGTQNETGTGLGLALCQEFVERHQGKIRVDSTPGTGSVFYITIPK